MGRILFKRNELAGTLSELVGYKSGLALGVEALSDHLGDDADLIRGDPDGVVVVRSEEFDEVVANLLFALGSTPVRRVVFPVIDFSRRYFKDPAKLRRAQRVVDIFMDTVNTQDDKKGPLDATPAAERCLRELGPEGLKLFFEFYELIQVKMQQSPFSQIRRVEWHEAADLEDLFRSESLDTQYGSFIDQRYIDYLHRNFDAIDDMNWRKFEALTCEFYQRSGYHVEIAEGRNDGGIDARIWREEAKAGEPPAILVQCKRQKEKVGKTIVKALWADVVHEGSESGLIVTTSALAPGAAQVCTARAYPVEEANRDTLRQWIDAMRTPFSGVFMGS